MSTAIALPMLEIADNIFVVDAAGNVIDLGDDPGSAPALALPIIATSLTGRGRVFGEDIGLVALEQVADSTRLIRDVTIRAFIKYEIAAAGVLDVGTICARGRRGSAAERLLFAAELVKESATDVRIRARWEEIGGGAAVVAGVVFTPDPTEFFHIAVVRRWIDSVTVEVDYILNDKLIGSEVVVEGDIGEGVAGSFTVGCVGNGAGDYELFLPAGSIIDQLAVETDAMSVEELRQEFRRITVHQPNGERILDSYTGGVEAWSKDPESRVRRWIAAEGNVLGSVIALAEQLREDFLPDRAYNEALEFWEKITGVNVAANATIAQRRINVLGFLRKTLGFPIADLKTALEPLFGLDSVDIEIFEFTGERVDDFSLDDISTPPSRIWLTYQGNGTVSIAAGVCTILAAGAVDLRLSPGGAPRREASVSPRQGNVVDGVTLVCEIDTQTLPVANDVVWGHIWRMANGDAVVIGKRFSVLPPGNEEIAIFEILGGVIGAVTPIIPLAAINPVHLLTRYAGGGVWDIERSVTGFSGLTGVAQNSFTLTDQDPVWCGIGIVGLDESTGGGAVDADFDDAHIFELTNERGFTFIAFRDPVLPGTFDLIAAQAQLDKQKPAHTIGIAASDKLGFTLGPSGTGRLGIHPLFPAGIP